ncbi:MAG: hypothetical protein IPJ85_17440 [Flavobacteriales bacterium]|nr:hypothetical protein [Flavobacteriales bacterium]
MTTSRRFATRTKDRDANHVIDARAKAVLRELSLMPSGKALSAYLRVFNQK